MTTTPGPLPILTEDTKVRTNVKTLVGMASVLVGAVIWCTVVYLDVQALKESDRSKSSQLDRMTTDMTAIREQVAHLTWIFDPRASRTSSPASVTP